MTDVHRVPEASCLNCGHRMNRAGSPDGSPIEPPQDGDLAVCIRCGAIMAYNSSGGLRGMTDAEMDEVTADHEYMDYLASLVKRVHFIQAMPN